MSKPVIRIAPNNQVFDLPVIVGIEEGLFKSAGLDVAFCASYDEREKDSVATPVLSRLKENLFESGKADSYNVCEWASIDRLEHGARGGNIAALRAAVAAQAILTFDEKLQTHYRQRYQHNITQPTNLNWQWGYQDKECCQIGKQQ